MNLAPLYRAFALSTAVLLTACAGAPTVSMKDSDRTAIRMVSIQPDVVLPEKMFISGRAQAAGAVGGLLGAALASAAPIEPSSQIVDTMTTHDISLQKILKAEFAKAGNAKGRMTFAEGAADADATVALTVNIYGFGQTQGFSALLYPLMNVSASMKRPDGTIVWQRTEFAGPLNSENSAGYEFQQYLNDPEKLRQVLTNISGIVGRMLANDLQPGR